MAINEEHFNNLFRKYSENLATPKEVGELFKLIREMPNDSVLQELLLNTLEETAPIADYDEQGWNKIFNDLMKQVKQQENRPIKRLWLRIAVAALILLALSFGGYFLLHTQPVQLLAQNQVIIKPGSNRAILTLSNGQQISLTDAQNGQLAKQHNTTITKTGNGEIVYNKTGSDAVQSAVQYNTITTLRGGQWPEIRLPDGTKVMLDAASSIRYPVQFSGNERLVEVTGQVYFEVKHDAAHPFKIKARGQIIEDIGTSFNINAYEDEAAITTTLVEGRVKVIKNDQSVILKPGQLAETRTTTNKILIKNADVEDAIAWKNGQTSFKGEDIQQIMRQVSRWYDVDITYAGTVPVRKFNGGISRKAELSDLLKILEFNNIHFSVEGKKIIVKP